MEQFDALTKDRGLYKKILKNGSGAYPNDQSKALIIIQGALQDGSIFENSAQEGKVVDLSDQDLIKGIKFAIKSMQKGEKSIIVMRDDYGYGESGNLMILPNSPLIFCIDLVDFQS